MLIKSVARWALPESAATSEEVFLNRRHVLAGFGLGGGLLASLKLGLGTAYAAESDPTLDLYPAKRNDAYKLDRPVTPEEKNLRYNNFYEFNTTKMVADDAKALKTRPWTVEIAGLCGKPGTLDIDKLIRSFPLEERLYRHRCVEAWSMAVPWTGFSLAKLITYAQPQAGANYVQFETFNDASMAPGLNATLYPWPYVEGLTMAEATNDLAFMVTGAYGKPLANQMGAPLRLALPWKYGFKSIKSIVKISFVADRPATFWQTIGPDEYGFWANVNPGVPHPRWSQMEERSLATGELVKTQLFNGYGPEVAGIYKGLEKERLYM